MAKIRLSLAIVFCILLALPAVVQAGSQLPEFTLPTVEGGTLSLRQFRGRVVVLDFFATWCRPCRAAIPKLNKLRQRYAKRGVSVIGFALDKGGVAKLRPFVARHRVQFPVVLGNLALARRLARVEVLPTTVVIDPQGRMVRRFEGSVGYDTLVAATRPYLRTRPPAEPPAARVRLRAPTENRFQRVWVENKQVWAGQRGLMIHVLVDVADLVAEQGLWLVLHLRPEARSDAGLAPVGKAKTLYQRVDDVSRRHFVLFVRCDQMPQAPSGGVLRSWLTVEDAARRRWGRSGDLIVKAPGCLTARAR